jgi:hypothetical protein
MYKTKIIESEYTNIPSKDFRFAVIKGKNSNNDCFNDGRWSKQEHIIFVSLILKFGIRNWKKVKFINLSLKKKLKQEITVRSGLISKNFSRKFVTRTN